MSGLTRGQGVKVISYEDTKKRKPRRKKPTTKKPRRKPRKR